MKSLRFRAAVVAIVLTTSAYALEQRSDPSRFDKVALPDPSVVVSPAPVRADARGFQSLRGKEWDVTIDARSGVPLLVQGEGIPLTAPATLDSLADQLRSFVTSESALTKSEESQMVLVRDGSGAITPELWKVVFDRTVAGIPVAGDRWVFYVGHGNLIAFGATRWSPITTSSLPYISAENALAVLRSYMGIADSEKPEVHDAGSLRLIPMEAGGAGYETALAWHLELEVPGEPGRWSALVDAHSGKVLALEDTIKYAFVKGGVNPITDDGICPDGCEQPNYPMPFANVTSGASSSTASSMGSFACSAGSATASTSLVAPFVMVVDNCGPISQSVACDADLDLKSSSGTDCAVPAGASAGNTHAARSSFYHLNRVKEHARAWLPANAWLAQQLRDNVNLNQACNAFWSSGGPNGTVNFYRSGGGCRNTGEIASVFLHEWGHGLDQNDGGGYDNPSEAYGDVTSFFITHKSCIGRGFHTTNCGAYGNACLSCTGVRDQDWDRHALHAPQTPESWPAGCPSGGGPCGKEEHCEAYLSAEVVWDLAARDLPASGLDPQTAWQVADRLWFKSRTGAGGNVYSCAAPATARSCAVNSWYTQFRTVDDDDGNLANGTPHAAAIFAAFNRHNIPCGTAADPTNQDHTSCLPLPAPAVSWTPGAHQVALSWSAVPGAFSYNVLRNDQGCDWGHTLVANVTGTSYTDLNLPDKFPLYYSIQPVGPASACVGALSACTRALAGLPHASYASSGLVSDSCASGGVGSDDAIYDSGEQIQFDVSLHNDGVTALTGVSVTLVPTTPGVTMSDDTAEYGSIGVEADGTSLAPHFSAHLPSTLTCGSAVSYALTIHTNEGTWTGSLTQPVGLVDPGARSALSESFSAGIPASWTIVDGGSGGASAPTWTTTNPGSRGFTLPLSAPVAMVDSFWAGSVPGTLQDEELVTPVMDLSAALTVKLDYDEFFRWNIGNMDEKGDVDVRSSLTGGAWVNVVRNRNASSPPSGTDTAAAHRSVSLTSQAAGASNVQLRFHYYDAYFEFWWEVDNVVVSYTVPPSCAMHTCILNADLTVAQSGPATAVAGDDVPYTVTVTNDGPDAAADAQLTDPVPSGASFRSLASPAGWSCATPALGGTGTIACSSAGVAAGTSADFTVVVQADPCAGDGAVLVNTATVSTTSSELDAGNDVATATTTLTGTGAGAPAEMAALTFPSKVLGEWSAVAAAGPEVVYDVVRGGVGEWPVGSGASEQCLASGTASTSVDITIDPQAGQGFWFLVRARSACGTGSYGANRTTMACP